MTDINALREILGKTIKGVIVKRNRQNNVPAMSLFLVFSDDTSYEIYSDLPFAFSGGLDRGGMDHARQYATPPKGPMENVLDLSLDEK